MIEQQLYLDGELMDLAKDTNIVLDIKSNLFRDITQMSSNSTYSISLPKTLHNMTVLENSIKPMSGSRYPYIFHTARYFRNGVEIIKGGRATILSVAENIEISIYFGLFPALTDLQANDLKLNELNCSDYVRFNKRNDLDTLEDARKKGVFYADYDTARAKSVSEDWTGYDIIEGDDSVKVYNLEDGRIFTGAKVGSNVLGEVIDDAAYRCAIIDFSAGMVATVQDVISKGDYRTWAILDENKNVLELADEVSGKKFTVGQAYRGGEDKEINGVPSFISYVGAGDIAANNYPISMTVLSIVIGLGMYCPAGTIEFGVLDITTGAAERWGEVSVSAGQGTVTATINRYKEEGKVVYLRPSADKMVFSNGIASDDSKILSYIVGSSGLQSSYANFVYSINYTSDNQAMDVELQAPATAAKLIVNTIKMYSTGEIVRIEQKTSVQSARASGGGSFGKPNYGYVYKGPVQPTVSCNYILNLISMQTKVNFSWNEKAQQMIDSLCVPLVTRNADSNTLDGGISGKLNDSTTLGALTMNLTKNAPAIFEQSANEDCEKLVAKVDCSLTFDVQMYWSFDPTGMRTNTYFGRKVYTYKPCYIEMKVVAPHTTSQEENEYIKTYIIGSENATNDDGSFSSYAHVSEEGLVNGKIIHLITGRGTLMLEARTIITFEAKRNNGGLRNMNFYGGKILANIQASDEVPYGGLFPIGKNLPDMSVKDFIKFLCLITNSYPLQSLEDGVLQLAEIGSLMADKASALDWTKKLIPYEERNLPRQTDFGVEDYCQHNIYKWKEDDTLSENHDADVVVDNNTLEYTRDVWTLPFAASDGSKVPIYDWEKVTSYFGGNEFQRDEATKYKACKDRIMGLFDNGNGLAALRFNIDLQKILNDDMADFRKMIGNSRKITEYMRLSDIDILEFDETKPVYLAQYGAYFAVLEIKTTSNGYSEVQMIEIK